MYQPPLRAPSIFDGKTVLLVDPNQWARDVLAGVLRSRGVEVDEADSIQSARSLWRPHAYDLVLLEARGQLSGEARDFYREVKHTGLRDRIVFLVGPPTYLSLASPADSATTEGEPQRLVQTRSRLVTAA